MPRGSNNRLDEANRDRANGNRLFDSQNNNRGGYNVGSTYYNDDSTIYTQWTNQHSCGSENQMGCEFVIQVMCDDWLRDGTDTKTIPLTDAECYENECDTDVEYGRHETQDYYYECLATKRNKGLFTAGQKLNGDDATKTRQNPGGTRRGYECPEERDYYPYWRPSPWKDIAIFTDQPQRCQKYQEESENVKGRYFCDVPSALYEINMLNNLKAWIPITQEECEAIEYPTPTYDENGDKITNIDGVDIIFNQAVWTQAASHGLPAPECKQNWWSRDNHLGNVMGGYMSMYNFTFASSMDHHEQCAYRMRYNITTGDYEAWESVETLESSIIDHTQNSGYGEPERDPSYVPIWHGFNIPVEQISQSFRTFHDVDENGYQVKDAETGLPVGTDIGSGDNNNNNAQSREYVFMTNPDVDIFGSLLTNDPSQYHAKLQLNINTNQYGRTFQDRSHRFALREADPNSECAGKVTHNVQVRGKRGNIVQTFPGMEYSFVPEDLNVQLDECIHFQWTGSNTNPNNNAGQGRQGTDRHNIVQLRAQTHAELGVTGRYGQLGRSFPAKIQDTSFLGWSDEAEELLAFHGKGGNFGGELSELDDASVYYDNKPKTVTQTGIFQYMCTRANNFSNRSEKAIITVSTFASSFAIIGWEGGSVAGASASVTFDVGTLSGATSISLLSEPAAETASEGKVLSDFHVVYLDADGTFTMSMDYTRMSIYGHKVMYHADHNHRDVSDSEWTRVQPVEWDHGTATFSSEVGEGVYVIQMNGLSTGWAVGVAVAVLLFIVAMFYVGNYVTGKCGFLPFTKNPNGSPISQKQTAVNV